MVKNEHDRTGVTGYKTCGAGRSRNQGHIFRCPKHALHNKNASEIDSAYHQLKGKPWVRSEQQRNRLHTAIKILLSINQMTVTDSAV